MKTIILMLVKNLATMLITKSMVFWMLEKWAGYTDNDIDDNVLLVVKGAYDSDKEMLKKGVEGLLQNE